MEETKIQTQQNVETKKEEKPKGPGIFERLKNKFTNYKRVVEVAKKPDKSEFISSVKITIFGIVLIGMIGFIIFLLYFLVT
ncbi:MAG: protein translocase SEC61 complex subunit gamma [Candidatus Aenigmatarchaeota archaeon]